MSYTVTETVVAAQATAVIGRVDDLGRVPAALAEPSRRGLGRRQSERRDRAEPQRHALPGRRPERRDRRRGRGAVRGDRPSRPVEPSGRSGRDDDASRRLRESSARRTRRSSNGAMPTASNGRAPAGRSTATRPSAMADQEVEVYTSCARRRPASPTLSWQAQSWSGCSRGEVLIAAIVVAAQAAGAAAPDHSSSAHHHEPRRARRDHEARARAHRASPGCGARFPEAGRSAGRFVIGDPVKISASTARSKRQVLAELAPGQSTATGGGNAPTTTPTLAPRRLRSFDCDPVACSVGTIVLGGVRLARPLGANGSDQRSLGRQPHRAPISPARSTSNALSPSVARVGDNVTLTCTGGTLAAGARRRGHARELVIRLAS